jgi:hypothetical protein
MYICVFLDKPYSRKLEIQNVWDADISFYGMYPLPGYVPFVLCFFIVPCFLVAIAHIRNVQLGSALVSSISELSVDPDDVGNWQHRLMRLISLSGFFLAIMGLSNGFFYQLIHFPCALLGMGLLVSYQVAHSLVWLQLSPKMYINCTFMFRFTVSCIYLIGPILAVLFVLKWIQSMFGNYSSWYEWVAVCMLFLHYIPLTIELSLQFESREHFTSLNANDDL